MSCKTSTVSCWRRFECEREFFVGCAGSLSLEADSLKDQSEVRCAIQAWAIRAISSKQEETRDKKRDEVSCSGPTTVTRERQSLPVTEQRAAFGVTWPQVSALNQLIDKIESQDTVVSFEFVFCISLSLVALIHSEEDGSEYNFYAEQVIKVVIGFLDTWIWAWW